jgi:AraC-like DNA-binding protein
MRGIICEKRVYTGNVVTHSHPYAQLVFPLLGAMYLNMENRNITVSEENIFLLPYDHRHSFKTDMQNQFLVLDIPSFMFEEKNLGLSEGITCTLNEKWQAIRFLLLDELRAGTVGETLSKLFYYFIPYMIQKQMPESLHYIHEHYNEDIDIETLAGIENYSVTYYREWFRKETGQSLMEYIRKRRIERAKELLISTNLNIMQIACEIGYSYESSFTKVFKIQENISPKAFRLLYN